MEITEEEDMRRMRKVITIDHRYLVNTEYIITMMNTIMDKVSNQIAQEYIELNRSKLLAALDIEVIKDLVNVQIASKVQRDHDLLMSRIDPMANSIPELNQNHNRKMNAILTRD